MQVSLKFEQTYLISFDLTKNPELMNDCEFIAWIKCRAIDLGIGYHFDYYDATDNYAGIPIHFKIEKINNLLTNKN